MFKVTSSVGGVARPGTILALEGRLAGGWVDELSRAVREPGAEAEPLTLDLSGLTFIDARGASVLRVLAARGARLVGGSPFVATLVSGSAV